MTDPRIDEARRALTRDLTVRQSPGDSLHPMSARAVQHLRDSLEEMIAAAAARTSPEGEPNDDTAHRLSLFLDEVTGSLLSKRTYDVATMVQATDERYARLRDEAIADALSDAAEEQGEPSEAQVDAAWGVIGRGCFSRDIVRAALRAAGEVTR